MVPSHFVDLDAFPLTPNGKVDRKALPVPNTVAAQPQSSEARMPRSESEKRIAAIFCEILELRNVGRDDDFFDLGGHSLTAVRTIARINQEFGVDLPVRVLFEAKTCAQLAHKVDLRANRQTGAEPERWPILVPIQPSGSGTPLFCVARPNVNALGYAMLARQLGPKQPVYGLQAQLPEDPALDFTPQQYEDTAREYIKSDAVRAAERAVSCDGTVPGSVHRFRDGAADRGDGAALRLAGNPGCLDRSEHSSQVVVRPYRYGMALRSRVLRILQKFKRARQDANQKCLIGPASSSIPATNPGAAEPRDPTPRQARELMRRTYFPGKEFKPPVISSKITVFAVDHQSFYRVRDKLMGWGDRTQGGVDAERVAGDHMTILREPHVSVLAQKIRLLLLPVPEPPSMGALIATDRRGTRFIHRESGTSRTSQAAPGRGSAQDIGIRRHSIPGTGAWLPRAWQSMDLR